MPTLDSSGGSHSDRLPTLIAILNKPFIPARRTGADRWIPVGAAGQASSIEAYASTNYGQRLSGAITHVCIQLRVIRCRLSRILKRKPAGQPNVRVAGRVSRCGTIIHKGHVCGGIILCILWLVELHCLHACLLYQAGQGMTRSIQLVHRIGPHNIGNGNNSDDKHDHADHRHFNQSESSLIGLLAGYIVFLVSIIECHNVFQITAEKYTTAAAGDERPFKSSPSARELKGDVGTNRGGTASTLVTSNWPCTYVLGAVLPVDSSLTNARLCGGIVQTLQPSASWHFAVCNLLSIRIFSSTGEWFTPKSRAEAISHREEYQDTSADGLSIAYFMVLDCRNRYCGKHPAAFDLLPD